jgi:hypothetical protein
MTTASAPDDGRSHLFLVRLWWEPDERSASGEWRGSVEHVATHEKRYFRDSAVLLEFVDAHSGWEARLPPSPSREGDDTG